MRRQLLVLFIVLFLFSSLSFAANTTVTATITGQDSIVWSGGTYSISFWPTPGVPLGQFNVNGSSFPQGPFTGTLDESGAFSLMLTNNLTIAPAGSKWNFTICPNASFGCFTTQVIVSGTTQNLSATLSALTPPITVPAAFYPRAYSTSQVTTPAGNGSTFFNTLTNFPEWWNGSSWVTLTLPVINCANSVGIGVTQIKNCIATVNSAGGGIADTTGITGTVAFTGGVDIFAGTGTNHIVVRAGPNTTWLCSQKINVNGTSSCIAMRSNTSIIGPGMYGGFVIKMADNQPTFSRLIETDVLGISNMQVSDLEMDGNAANNMTGNTQDHLIVLSRSHAISLLNLNLHDYYGDAIMSTGTNESNSTYNVLIDNIMLGDGYRAGVGIISGHHIQISHIRQFTKSGDFAMLKWEPSDAGQVGHDITVDDVTCQLVSYPSGSCDITLAPFSGTETDGSFANNKLSNIVITGGAVLIETPDTSVFNLSITDPWGAQPFINEGPGLKADNITILGGAHRYTGTSGSAGGIYMDARFPSNYPVGYCGNKLNNILIDGVSATGIQDATTYTNCTHNQYNNITILNVHNVGGLQLGYGLDSSGDYAQLSNVKVINDGTGYGLDTQMGTAVVLAGTHLQLAQVQPVGTFATTIWNLSGVPSFDSAIGNPGLANVLTNGLTTTTLTTGAGGNTVYRCVTAGATLPVGSLTINATACGTTADTGLRTP